MAAKVKKIRDAWWVVTHHRGERQHKKIGISRADKRRAEEIAKEINLAIALGRFSSSGTQLESAPPVLFKDFAQRWLEREMRLPLERGDESAPAEKTVRLAESHIRLRLNPSLAGKDLKAITKGDIQEVYDWCLNRKPQWSPRTIEMTLAVLHQIFTYAETIELIDSNPVEAWRRTRTRRRNSGVRPVARENVLDSEELSQLLSATAEIEPDWLNFIYFLAATGTRLGEASALLWADVDLEARTARIRRSFSDGKTLSTTKTGKERTIELSSRLVSALSEIRPDIVGNDSLVFPNRAGGYINPHNFRARAFRRIVTRALGPNRKFSPHGLRHTFASLHLAFGTNLKWIQNMGGWSSAKLLLDLYGHFLPTESTGFADAIDGGKRHYTAPTRSAWRTRELAASSKDPQDRGGGSLAFSRSPLEFCREQSSRSDRRGATYGFGRVSRGVPRVRR